MMTVRFPSRSVEGRRETTRTLGGTVASRRSSKTVHEKTRRSIRSFASSAAAATRSSSSRFRLRRSRSAPLRIVAAARSSPLTLAMTAAWRADSTRHSTTLKTVKAATSRAAPPSANCAARSL